MRKWKRLLTRDANILLKRLVVQGVEHGPSYILPQWKGMQNHLWTWHKGETGIHYLFSELEEFSNVVVREALQHPSFVREYRSQSKELCDTVVQNITERVRTLNDQPSITDLQECFQYFCDQFARLAETIVMTLEEIESRVLSGLHSREDLGALVATPELSIDAVEELHRLRIISDLDRHLHDVFVNKSIPEIHEALQNDPDIDAKINEHLNSFCWIPLNFEKEIWDKDFFLRMFQSYITDHYDYRSRLQELEQYTEHVIAEKQRVLKSGVSGETQILAELLEATAFIRMYRANIFSLAYYRAFPLLESIGACVELPLNVLKYYTPDEIRNALKTKTVLDRERGLSRKTAFAILILNHHYAQYEGPDVETIMKQELPEETEANVTEIRGASAYPGVAKGTVKVISDAREMSKVHSGDILVCVSTNPDLVIAMGRASAIVTDEGGITSHAAIVSRELKKPCVIGTKVATKLLKDGDLVEVDANNGIVKKIA